MQPTFKTVGFFSRHFNRLRNLFSRLFSKNKPKEKGNETLWGEIDRFRRKLHVIPAYEETVVYFMYQQTKKLKTQHRLDTFIMIDMKLTDKGYKETRTHFGYQGNQIENGEAVPLTDVRGIKKFPRGEIFDFIVLANGDGWVCSAHAEELIDSFVADVFKRYTEFSKVKEIHNLISYQYTFPKGDAPPQIKVVYPDPTNQEPAGIAPTLVIDFIKTPNIRKN